MWRSGALLTPVLLFGTLMGGRRVEAAVPWPNFVVCVLVLEVNTMWFWAAPYPQPPLPQAHGTSKDGETGEGGWIKKRGGDCNRIGWMESDKVLRIKMSSSREEINRTQAKTLRLFSSGGFGVCVCVCTIYLWVACTSWRLGFLCGGMCEIGGLREIPLCEFMCVFLVSMWHIMWVQPVTMTWLPTSASPGPVTSGSLSHKRVLELARNK